MCRQSPPPRALVVGGMLRGGFHDELYERNDVSLTESNLARSASRNILDAVVEMVS